jgi:hypothetical protein
MSSSPNEVVLQKVFNPSEWQFLVHNDSFQSALNNPELNESLARLVMRG